MRIAVVSAVYPPTRGGMCTVAAAEAQQLAKHHAVRVFTLQTDNPRKDLVVDRSSDVPITRLIGLPRISLGGFVPQLFFKLRDSDVVYAELPAYGFMEVLLLWKLITKKRLVVTVHMDPVGVGFYKYLFKIERFVLRTLIQSADAIRISTEQFAKDPLFSKVKKEKITIIPFGIDLKRFRIEEHKDKFIFLFVGRLSRTHYFKGVELLLRAFKTVAEKNTDTELWIVGDGDERKNYEHLAEKFKIMKRVRFLGAVADDELPHIYRQASVMVLPSTDTSETFGLVLLEAMASGVPVIASRLPGVDTVVNSFDVGQLVEPGDEVELTEVLQHAAEHQDLWRSRSRAARVRAEEYGDWSGIADKIVSLL